MKFASIACALLLLCAALSFSQSNPPNSSPQTAPAAPDAKAPAAAPPAPGAPAPAAPASSAAKNEARGNDAKGTVAKGEGVITEAELRQRLVGRPLYLRGLWLDETLHFNMDGDLVGQSPKGSFTLCGVTIDKVRMTKKAVELEGVRFGVHFEGEAPWEDQATSFDRIQITPKKKHQLIVIDRQLVVVPKKKKGEKGPAKGAAGGTASGEAGAAEQAAVADADLSNAGAVKAGGEKTAEATTTSPVESAGHLRGALNKIFAPDLDAKMVAAMPDYWQFFYQAQESHKWLEPTDQTLAHVGPGVEGPRIVKNVVPESNDFAQHGEVAGVASYKVILDPAGKILAVAVYRPIGFGLDENAVAAIQKSTFAGAVKDGKPVASVIDVAVNFRIYSKRTAQGVPDTAQADAVPNASPVTGKQTMPGPYSATAPKQ